jgi:hypothetical protein
MQPVCDRRPAMTAPGASREGRGISSTTDTAVVVKEDE